MRAKARREKFLYSLREDGAVEGDNFEGVRALFSSGEQIVWKKKKAFMGKILIQKANGELTKEGSYLETQGWTRPGRTKNPLVNGS